MLVRARDKYEELNIEDIELKKKPKKGDEWEITEERFEVLTKNNPYNAVFVEKVRKKKTE